ncbi:PIN domain-containing protein [Candidatus Woesearchaeota archaeon]|nr:PIN domain-containing protein [Candidatus Woesearchaeota archaeon]
MTDIFVFDTYALIELIEGNPAYLKYANAKMVINEFIFAELCYAGIKRYRDYPVEAEQKSRSAMGSISAVSPEEIMKAMKFRFSNRKKELSTTDCVSYIQAQRLGILFLTGDKEFENMPGVEFVR